MKKTCPICGILFVPARPDRMTCGRRCGRALANKKRYGETTADLRKTCPVCGITFGPSKGQHNTKFLRRLTCGRSCGQTLSHQRKNGRITAAGGGVSEVGKLHLSVPSRFNGQLTRDLTILAAAELRDVRRSIEYARQRMRPVGPLEAAARRLEEVIARSQWRVAV